MNKSQELISEVSTSNKDSVFDVINLASDIEEIRQGKSR